ADATERPSSWTWSAAAGGTEGYAFGYDGGLLTSLTATGLAQGRFTYTYDANFLPAAIALTSGADHPQVNITRDADGLVTGIGTLTFTRGGPLGRTSAIGDGTLSDSRTYDSGLRLTSRSQSVASAATDQEQLSFDASDHVSGRVETVAGTTHTFGYTYD